MSEVRSIPIERAIRFSEASFATEAGPGPVKLFEYCPGNGTRYVLLVTDVSKMSDEALKHMGRSGDRCYVVSHLNGGAGHSMTVGGGDFLHYNYVREKLKVNEVDAVVIAEIVAFMCQLKAVSCEEYTREKA